ncbi:gephyrin-like molybdotransferase Glp [Stappia indica]|uniref:Molybdopterin molybdenumtransferase n=1 Tax=Stappia indica TaxID=538381 RepID=A0A857C2Z8_9HYPH|nr:gephyrin-like molybdotransferase Glp [Stappia indica]QGZ33327.1 molybdopterin molybdenumtransferase MoeA [Stappia indica]
MALISVDEALSRLLGGIEPVGGETVPLASANGRVLAADLAATRTQPPFAASAMDGYAVRAADIAAVPATLKLIGEAPAGRAFTGAIKAGETVRIFTGAPLPEGSDTILIQENTERDGDLVTALESAPPGKFVRPAGLDFKAGETLLAAGTRLDYRRLALAAAMNHPVLELRRRPKVAILATGDELVEPGEQPGSDQIIASNHAGIAALVEDCGGEPLQLGIAADRREHIAEKIAGARAAGADILVTLGGASVGDHDLVQEVLAASGMELGFWRIAMRPGKPLMAGRIEGMRVLGLPGNPVSSLVCGVLFLRPLIDALLGRPPRRRDAELLPLAADIGGNDQREDYLRARILRQDDGTERVAPFERQDSSMLATLTRADALVVRPPHAAPLPAGTPVPVLRLPQG